MHDFFKLICLFGLLSLAQPASAQVVQSRSPTADVMDAAVVAGVPEAPEEDPDAPPNASDLPLGDLGLRAPITFPSLTNLFVAPPPPLASGHADRQEQMRRERAARRDAAQEVCRRESNRRLVDACLRCAERGDPYRWLERGAGESAQRMLELMAVSGQSEGVFRCLDGRLRSTHRLIGELFRRDRARQREMNAMRTDLTQVQQAQGSIEPQLVARVMPILLGALHRDRLEREIDAQTRRADDCDAGRLDTLALSAAERALPEAPESMVLWSEAEVRAQGFRPRRPAIGRPNCAEVRHGAQALREALEAQLRDGSLPSTLTTSRVFLLYQGMARDCAAGASPACATAQTRLSAALPSVTTP